MIFPYSARPLARTFTAERKAGRLRPGMCGEKVLLLYISVCGKKFCAFGALIGVTINGAHSRIDNKSGSGGTGRYGEKIRNCHYAAG